MSRIDKRKVIDVEYDLDEVLKDKDKAFVLFYASWCPFSQQFLPTFNKYAQTETQECIRVKIDDKASLMKKYSVEVVPTVLLFKKGTVKKRLDGAPGQGLTEKQFKDLLKSP